MSATFSVTRDQIITGALRLMGVLGQYNSATTNDLTYGAEALNMLVKQVMIEGLDLWTYSTVAVPMVANQVSYTIGPSGNVVTDRPLRVAHAYVRDSTSHDTPIFQLSKQEYNIYALKTQTGVPNSFYYDPQLTNGVLYVYPVPSDATRTIYVVVQRPIADFNSGTDVPDFPNEWYQYLKFALAEAMSMEYEVPLERLAYIARKAEDLKDKLVGWSQEEASTFFTPRYYR